MTVSLNERLQANIEQDKKALSDHRTELEKASKAQMQKLSNDLQKHAVNSASACENALKVTVSAIEKLKAETIQRADKNLSDHLANLDSQLDKYSETSRHQLKSAGVWTLAALIVSVLIVLSGFGLGWIAFNWNKSGVDSLMVEKTVLRKKIDGLKADRELLTLWGMTPRITEKGRFLMLKKGTKWDGGIWTFGKYEAVRVGD